MANNELIRYWHSAAKLNLLNQRMLPREHLSCARFIPMNQIAKGCLDNGLGTQEDVYVAPFCFKKGVDLTIPFWLEATLLATGELQAKKKATLPWILPTFLDEYSASLPILNFVHMHDALCADYFGSLNNISIFHTWAEYYTECIRFMSELRTNWKQEFIQSGFDLLESAIVLPISEMLTSIPKSNNTLSCYANLDFFPNKSLEKVSAPVLQQGLLGQNMTLEEKKNLLAVIGLESGDFLAIEAEEGAPFQKFFIDWIQYISLQYAINEKPLPTVLIVLPEKKNIQFEFPTDFAFSPSDPKKTLSQFVEVFKQYFSQDQFEDAQLTPEYMSAYIHETLHFNYQQYQQGGMLIKRYYNTITKELEEWLQENLEEKVQNLQSHDTILEQRYQGLQAAKTELSIGESKNLINQIWKKLAQNQSKYFAKNIKILSQYIFLEEIEKKDIKKSDNILEWIGLNLRKVQVERTKLHAELVALSEKLAQRKGQWLRLLNWEKQNKGDILAGIDPIGLPDKQEVLKKVNDFFGKILVKLAQLYWQAQQYLGGAFICKIRHQDPHKIFSYQEKKDYLFILDANHFSPMLGLNFCSMAEKVIAFSGPKTLAVPLLTPLQDTWLTQKHNLREEIQESLLEEMGALVSTGDVFQVVKAHSVYEDPSYPGMGYTQSFYLKEEANDNAFKLKAKIDFQPILGQRISDRGSYVNKIEAQHLLKWLTQKIKNPADPKPDCDQIMVVTAFAAQKYYLDSLLEGISIPVYTLREAIGKRSKWVLISMVQDGEALGPSVYDQNPLLLSEMIRLAEEKVIVFADPGIFALSHTTLGKFAHKVMARTPEQKNDIIYVSSL